MYQISSDHVTVSEVEDEQVAGDGQDIYITEEDKVKSIKTKGLKVKFKKTTNIETTESTPLGETTVTQDESYEELKTPQNNNEATAQGSRRQLETVVSEEVVTGLSTTVHEDDINNNETTAELSEQGDQYETLKISQTNISVATKEVTEEIPAGETNIGKRDTKRVVKQLRQAGSEAEKNVQDAEEEYESETSELKEESKQNATKKKVIKKVTKVVKKTSTREPEAPSNEEQEAKTIKTKVTTKKTKLETGKESQAEIKMEQTVQQQFEAEEVTDDLKPMETTVDTSHDQQEVTSEMLQKFPQSPSTKEANEEEESKDLKSKSVVVKTTKKVSKMIKKEEDVIDVDQESTSKMEITEQEPSQGETKTRTVTKTVTKKIKKQSKEPETKDESHETTIITPDATTLHDSEMAASQEFVEITDETSESSAAKKKLRQRPKESEDDLEIVEVTGDIQEDVTGKQYETAKTTKISIEDESGEEIPATFKTVAGETDLNQKTEPKPQQKRSADEESTKVEKKQEQIKKVKTKAAKKPEAELQPKEETQMDDAEPLKHETSKPETKESIEPDNLSEETESDDDSLMGKELQYIKKVKTKKVKRSTKVSAEPKEKEKEEANERPIDHGFEAQQIEQETQEVIGESSKVKHFSTKKKISDKIPEKMPKSKKIEDEEPGETEEKGGEPKPQQKQPEHITDNIPETKPQNKSALEEPTESEKPSTSKAELKHSETETKTKDEAESTQLKRTKKTKPKEEQKLGEPQRQSLESEQEVEDSVEQKSEKNVQKRADEKVGEQETEMEPEQTKDKHSEPKEQPQKIEPEKPKKAAPAKGEVEPQRMAKLKKAKVRPKQEVEEPKLEQVRLKSHDFEKLPQKESVSLIFTTSTTIKVAVITFSFKCQKFDDSPRLNFDIATL